MSRAPHPTAVVLVTGAARGLGAALCAVLEARGHVAVRGVRRPDPDDGPGGGALAMDVTDQASVDAAVAACVRIHGRLDCVISNAGVAAPGPVEHIDPVDLARVLDVNVVGPHRVARAALPHLRLTRGAIVLISSGLSRVPVPFTSAYGATKAAAELLADGLAVELAGQGVRVAVVQPGPIATGFGAGGGGAAPPPGYEALAALVDADRTRRRASAHPVAMSADAVAQAVVDLVESPAHTWPHRLVVHPEPAPLRHLADAEAAVRRQALVARGYGDHLPPQLA